MIGSQISFSLKKVFRVGLICLGIIPIIILSLLLSHNAILYFTHGGEYGILPEKLVARQDWLWNVSFYLHLPAGIICLLSPIFLFTRVFLKKGLQLHQWIGKIYVWVTLYLVCPTGFYLALYAKGGFISQAGFVFQGILLVLFTFRGYQFVRKGNIAQHLQYMIRSYAIASAVLTFRVLHIFFFLWKVPYQDNYAISQWLGIFLNWWLAENVISYIKSHKSKSRLTFNPLPYEN